MISAKQSPSSHALTRAWTQLSAQQRNEVAPHLVELGLQVGGLELTNSALDLGDRFTKERSPSTAQGHAPQPHAAGTHAALTQHAVPTAGDLKRADTLVCVALAGVDVLPSTPALLEKVFSRSSWSVGATSAAHALAGVSLSDTWRGLVAEGRVVVVGEGGLGGSAAHFDTQGRVLLDAKALARLPADERRFVVLRSVLEAALLAASKKNPPGPNRDHGAPAGFIAARATALARALLASAPALDLHGKALYYPAGGSDVKSVRGVAERVQGIGSAVSIDIAYTSEHALAVTDGITLHAVPGDALFGDVRSAVRAHAGTSIGGVQLLAPGDFGGLRKEASFTSTTLGALDVGGVVFNHQLWGYGPMTRQLPPAFLGLALTDVIGTNGHDDVEVLNKTREVPDAVRRAIHNADRLVACFMERMQSGRLGQLLSDDAWVRPFVDRREPYLPELALLARTLDEASDPHLSGLAWQLLWHASEQPNAQLTDEERCVIAAHAMQSSAHAGVVMKDTSLPASPSASSAPASSASSAEDAAAFVARLASGERLPGTIADELAAFERVLPLAHQMLPREAQALAAGRTSASFFIARLATLGPAASDLSPWASAAAVSLERAVFGLVVLGEGAADTALLSTLLSAVERARAALEGGGADAMQLRERLSLTAVVAEAQARRASLTQA